MISIISRAFTVIRGLLYSVAFIGLWAWLASYVRRFDPQIPVALPGWLVPVGLLIACGGGLVTAACIATFVTVGHGTPAPFDPPRHFVAIGPYRYVRNPMYIGAAAVLLGSGMYLSSPSVVLLAFGFLFLMHLFVVLHEEAALTDRFGDSYLRYKATVRRWLVRRPQLLLFCFAMFVVSAAQGQQTPPVAKASRIDFSKIEIKTARLSDHFFTLEGHGGTISVLTGPDGVLMVDGQFAPLTDKIVAAIRKITDQPIRFLVNTHVHADHTGGNENLARIGALIFSRDQLRQRLMNPAPGPNGQSPPPAPMKALPVVTYDGPVTLHVNGEDVQLIPIRAAHTDGDTLIRFPKHDILAVGDYYRSVGYPFVDIFNGGTLEGLLAGLDETIGLAGPKTKIIPGHGAIVDRNAVIAHRDLVLEMRDRMRPLIAQGMTIEQVLAANPTSDTEVAVPPGAQTAEQFVRWMYAELRKSQ